MLVLVIGIGLVLHAAVPSVAYAQINITKQIGTTLAQIMNFFANGIGSLTLMVIEVIIVNVLNYNNFSSSNIVTLGWTITRDMVNMFAVIVLLILAVKTMVGQTASAWQQHLPRFFLGIVFANFSRTLCGLAVDASQIIMMTFVNALMSIAAGNFAQLMVMPSATTYSAPTFEALAETGVVLAALAANIANAYGQLMVNVIILAVILLIAIAFIWRIIVLWIAFIMAPLAAFSWGSKEIVGFLGRFYQEWIAQFVPPLVLGPMLAFFLYLALAASSNGNLAKAEAFPEPKKRTTYGQVTLEIFESTNFTGLLLAVVFLIMGLKEAASTAAKMGGLASVAFNEKTAGRLFRAGSFVSGAVVGTPAKLMARGGLNLTSGTLGLTSSFLKNKGFNSAAQMVGAVGSAVNVVDKQVGLIPTDISKIPGYAKNRGAAMAKEASTLATSAGAGLSGAIARNVSNPALAGILNAMGPNALLAAGSALSTQEHHISEAEEKAAKERVSHMTSEEKAARLRQSIDGTGENSIQAQADAKHLKGLLLKDKKFNDKFKDTVGNDEYEKSMKKIFHDLQHEDEAGHLSVEKETWDKARSKYADIFAATAPENDVKKFFASNEFDIQAMRNGATANPKLALALAATQTRDKKDGKFITRFDQMSDRQKDQAYGASQEMYEAFNEIDNISKDSMRALSHMEGNPAVLNAGTAAKIKIELANIEAASDKKGFAESEIAAIRKNLIASGHVSLEDSFGGSLHNASFDLAGNRKGFKTLIQNDPSILRDVNSAGLINADTDVAKTTFDALSNESFEKMKEMVDAGARTKQQTKDALVKIREVLKAREEKARNNVDETKVKNLLKEIKDAATALKTASAADRATLEANLQAAKANHDATIAGMDKDTIEKIKKLRNSLEATERYL